MKTTDTRIRFLALAEHPSVFYSMEGAQAEQRESLGGLRRVSRSR